MGLCIALQTESGKQIELEPDSKNLLSKLLGSPDANTFPMLASIDPYGDTVFNQIQIERFLTEWETLFKKVTTHEEKSQLQAVRVLAERARNGVHLYLVFIGD